MLPTNSGVDAVDTIGRRLPIHVLEDTAASYPDRPFAFAPRSTDLSKGWEPISYKQLSNAVNFVAHIIGATVKAESKDTFPTLGYMGPNDIRYTIICLAAIKAGCKALFISPRNTSQGQLDLLEKTNCHHFWYAESFHDIVKPWISQRSMTVTVAAEAHEWLAAKSAKYPYERNYKEGRFDPFVVLHTSGSTGIPKPIVERQASFLIADKYSKLPKFHGGTWAFQQIANEAKRLLMPLPLFHCAGFTYFTGIVCLYLGLPLVLGAPDQPLTPEIVMEYLKYSEADSAFLTPSVLEGLVKDEKNITILKKLKHIIFGGGNLSTRLGNKLVENGIRLHNVIGSTE